MGKKTSLEKQPETHAPTVGCSTLLPTQQTVKIRHFSLTFVLLLLFWLLLSGHYDVFHISIGVFCCLLISHTSSELLFIHVGAEDTHLIVPRFLAYIPWHLHQIILSNIYVAQLVLSPKARLNPQIITYKTTLNNGLALVTFANSITLTPGTITVDLVDDLFHVHAIDDKVADDLNTGEMEDRISNIFLPLAHAHERSTYMLSTESDNLIVKTVIRIFIPFIQLYALYVIAHGHYSPGGGFQGGVILGASIILLALAFDIRKLLAKMGEGLSTLLCSTGVFIYGGIGLLCLLLGGKYLDYAALAGILGVDPPHARSLGILGVEIGVGIAVMAAMVSIFLDIATGGKLPATQQDDKQTKP
ncbi:MAG: Na(+)/H(+) antiporter subunit B [Deltaproteobacteria bacterium]|nr:Na(+)/H(+) antiporter subunit B [Candidatus Anaeroferrophillus wilburensis]MBN2889095.1 Na(+)/H(+) antiporter subunit B [Deltaproteobacteria bacterium]